MVAYSSFPFLVFQNCFLTRMAIQSARPIFRCQQGTYHRSAQHWLAPVAGNETLPHLVTILREVTVPGCVAGFVHILPLFSTNAIFPGAEARRANRIGAGIRPLKFWESTVFGKLEGHVKKGSIGESIVPFSHPERRSLAVLNGGDTSVSNPVTF